MLRNSDVTRILAGIPRGHLHLRLLVETASGERIVFHEATVAAIVRAYTSIVCHPTRRAVEMALTRLGSGERKPGYAEHQLLETGRSEEEVLEELERVLEEEARRAGAEPLHVRVERCVLRAMRGRRCLKRRLGASVGAGDERGCEGLRCRLQASRC